MEPRILALDEPTTHLDPPARKAFINLLRALPQAKLLVTHDTSLALELASRAVFFEAGKINSNGPVTEILARYGWT
jgi:cobalt/nickel transport system ATP-binding protein